MSARAQLNFSTGDWLWSISPEPYYQQIYIGFTGKDLPVRFDNLSFGLNVTSNGESIFEGSYPPSGARYVSTDQEYISSDQVKLKPDDLVTVSVWAENAGIRYEGDESFVVPRPDQPYPSWEWNGDYWEAPVQYPTDGEDGVYYEWNETDQSWVESEENG